MSGLSLNAQFWLSSGARCIAAETLFTYCTGVDALGDHGDDHPRTLADFRVCRLLLDQCPELRSCLPRVGHISREWAEFVSFWDDICMIHDLEDPDWREHSGKAPQATAMINHILERLAPVTE